MQLIRKFVHGELFEKQWKDLGLTDENLRELQSILLENPKAGPVMSGTGRLRKIRYSYGNRGKSHCARVCYVDFEINGIIFLIMVFAKNEMENLSSAEKNNIKALIDKLGHEKIKGISHITGGGFYENIPRSIPDGLSAVIVRKAVKVLPIFNLIAVGAVILIMFRLLPNRNDQFS